jgi:hypothetical protein
MRWTAAVVSNDADAVFDPNRGAVAADVTLFNCERRDVFGLQRLELLFVNG